MVLFRVIANKSSFISISVLVFPAYASVSLCLTRKADKAVFLYQGNGFLVSQGAGK